MPQEQPPPDSHCIVESCSQPATVYVDIADGADLEGENAVPMCDEHASNWRRGASS